MHAPIFPEYWPKATKALSARDAVMKQIVRSYKGERLAPRGDAFYTLARAIAGQQISVKAADTVWKRLEEAAGNMHHETIRAMEEGALRACGLSASKVRYLHGLSDHFTEHALHAFDWSGVDDEEAIKMLVSIKGIGRWTAEMFLIFHLARPDVFPLADIGVQKAMRKHYGGGRALPLARMEKIALKWKPWRSVATWYLWRSLDPVPVVY